MPNMKKRLEIFKNTRVQVAGVLLLVLLASFLLWFANATSWQAEPALMADVYFDGWYRVGDGDWKEIKEGEHIPATSGEDVTLRGNFHMLAPDGTYAGPYRGEAPIALYTDHISLTFYEVGFEPDTIDSENPIFGDASCGAVWSAYVLKSREYDMVDILIHNPHSFGNETAIDEMLSNVAIWADMDFEKGILNGGEPQRNAGMLLMLVSVVFLGIALFSTLIHIKNSKIIWLLGLVTLFAGMFFAYSATGLSFWSSSTVSNTILHGLSMMFYMFSLSMVITCLLKRTKPVGNIIVALLGVALVVFFILPIVSDILFYDLLAPWSVIQLVASGVLAACLVREFAQIKEKIRWLYAGTILPLLAYAVDMLGALKGLWKDGLVSQYVFSLLFVVATIMVLKLIPNNINAAMKARELELEKITLNAQLAESRISTMMSQIRPHFIYNTLGSIEQLCKLDPPKAGDLVHNFAKYLRGNFGELDNPKPILMSQEMEHVRHYISIENVRFPDMTFTFEMNSTDFPIPALTVQPIVENAIKHGLMKLPKGGTIRVVSYETAKEYCISVVDDGVGFDMSALSDDRKHVGIRNIRERLKVMVNGTLEIESTVGVGTKVLIRIPKEARI